MTQVNGMLRYLATAAAAYVAGRGWLPQDVATELAVAIVALVPAIYDAWKSRTQGKIETAAKIEGVTIIAPDHLANASTKNNVVAASETEISRK